MIPRRKSQPSKMLAVLKTCRVAFLSLVIFSFISNALMLTGPLFMLQVYDRVLNSGSIPTLVALLLLVIILFALYGFLEFIRTRVLVRVSRVLEEALRERIFDVVSYHALKQTPNVRLSPMQDMQAIRQFLQSPGPLAFMDMPWSPFYLGVIYMLHPYLGLFATAAVFVLITIAVVNDRITRRHAQEAQLAAAKASTLSEEARRNVEVASVLGMLGVLRDRWKTIQGAALDALTKSSDRGGMLSSMSKALRLLMQSCILGLGAYLAVKQEVSPGAMIAASIIMSRALQPVEMAVAQWAGFQAFRRAWVRLNVMLDETPEAGQRMALPAPAGTLKAENLIGYIPGVEKPIVSGISFELPAGTGLGIIGPTGAGKTTLARLLVGLWPHKRGTVRIDGQRWSSGMPNNWGVTWAPAEEVELFDGTIGQNIARFAVDARPEDIVAAAEEAKAHDFILNLPTATTPPSARAPSVCRPASARGSASPVPFTATRWWWCWTNPTPTSMPRAKARFYRPLPMSAVAAAPSLSSPIAPAPSPRSTCSWCRGPVRSIAYGPRDEVLKKVLARPVTTSGQPGGLSVVSERPDRP